MGLSIQSNFALARYLDNGAPDAQFDSDGKVQTDLGGADTIRSIVVQPNDSKIVVAGYSQTTAGSQYVIARYLPSGALDPEFGDSGVVETGLPFAASSPACLQMPDPATILLVAGAKKPDGSNAGVLLAEYDLAGNPVSGFGTNGRVISDLGAAYGSVVNDGLIYTPGSAQAVTIDSSGRIIIAGAIGGDLPDGHGRRDWVVARFNPDGSLDGTFGTAGVVIPDPEPNQVYELDVAKAIAIQADGQIVVAGDAGSTAPKFGVARFNENGTLDSAFGQSLSGGSARDGIVVTPILNNAWPWSVVVQNDGKIVASGDASDGSRHVIALARYNPDGTLDQSFGEPAPPPAGITVTPTSGLVTTEAGGTASFTVVLDSRPTADVTIPVSSSDTTEGTVLVSSLTFTSVNWNIPQTVTVRGVDDPIRDGDIAYRIVLGHAVSDDLGYAGLDPADVSVINKDNEKGKITSTVLSPAALTDVPLAGAGAERLAMAAMMPHERKPEHDKPDDKEFSAIAAIDVALLELSI